VNVTTGLFEKLSLFEEKIKRTTVYKLNVSILISAITIHGAKTSNPFDLDNRIDMRAKQCYNKIGYGFR